MFKIDRHNLFGELFAELKIQGKCVGGRKLFVTFGLKIILTVLE